SALDLRAGASVPRYLVERLLLDTSGYLEDFVLNNGAATMKPEIHAARERLAESGHPVPAVEAMSRYAWVGRMLEGVITRPTERVETLSDRIDHVLTHRLWGTFFFILMM